MAILIICSDQMAAQLTVRQGETPITVDLPPTVELGEGPGVTETAEKATAAAVFGFFDTAATKDSGRRLAQCLWFPI